MTYRVLVTFDYVPDGQTESRRVTTGDTITSVDISAARAAQMIALGVIEVIP